MSTATISPQHTKQLFGHPIGLSFLFFTEMWERFSFYGMRSLLIYYMIKHLLIEQGMASNIYGLYTGFVYFTPILGGLLADRVLGQRRTVVVGASLMAIGHFLMAFEFLFYPALIFLILGNGAFKPNISTQVGALYAPGDKRRDSAFSIFYMGINLGAFFSPLICGTLGELVGWHYGFGAAGVGMIIGLIIYLCGQKYLSPDYKMQKQSGAIVETTKGLTKDEYSRVYSLLILCALCAFFWAVYEQQGNTMALFADTYTNRYIGKWQMPASWFQSFNPAMIFIFAPLIAGFWSWQSKTNKEPSSVTKMAYGLILLSLAFLVMIPAALMVAKSQGLVSMWWLVASTFLLTIGELYLSPVGLSLVTKVAPLKIVSMMMGIWFIANFAGNYLAGYIGSYWNKMPKENFFILLTGLAFTAGLILVFSLNPLKKAISRGTDIHNL